MYFSTARFCSACCCSSAQAPSDFPLGAKQARLPLFCSTRAAICSKETSKHSQISDLRRNLGFPWRTSLSHSLAPGCLMDIPAFKEDLSFSNENQTVHAEQQKKNGLGVFFLLRMRSPTLTHSLTCSTVYGKKRAEQKQRNLSPMPTTRRAKEKRRVPLAPPNVMCMYVYIYIYIYVICIYRGP